MSHAAVFAVNNRVRPAAPAGSWLGGALGEAGWGPLTRLRSYLSSKSFGATRNVSLPRPSLSSLSQAKHWSLVGWETSQPAHTTCEKPLQPGQLGRSAKCRSFTQRGWLATG